MKLTEMLANNVYIITSKAGPVMNGCTASWVTVLSNNPKLVGVSISKEHFTYWVINQSSEFIINILADNAKAVKLANYFKGQSGKDENDKMSKVNYFLGLTESPVLKDAIAYVECKVVKKYETGDHYLFVGEVVNEKLLKKNKVLTIGSISSSKTKPKICKKKTVNKKKIKNKIKKTMKKKVTKKKIVKKNSKRKNKKKI